MPVVQLWHMQPEARAAVCVTELPHQLSSWGLIRQPTPWCPKLGFGLAQPSAGAGRYMGAHQAHVMLWVHARPSFMCRNKGTGIFGCPPGHAAVWPQHHPTHAGPAGAAPAGAGQAARLSLPAAAAAVPPGPHAAPSPCPAVLPQSLAATPPAPGCGQPAAAAPAGAGPAAGDGAAAPASAQHS